jgi:magnesium chelatase family protein
MSRASVTSAMTLGVEGQLLTVEADIGPGLPGTHLLGLGGSATGTRDRVRAALLNSNGGLVWPQTRVTVSVFPISVPAKGTAVDLAIAITILAASGQIPATALNGTLFIGQLGLDGGLWPIRGAVPMVAAAADAGLDVAIVPVANAAEAAGVPGITVVAVSSLRQVIAWLTAGGPTGGGQVSAAPSSHGSSKDAGDVTPELPAADLADLPTGYPDARYALEVCAAGGHHLMVYGRPDSPAVMLTERLPGLVPPLEAEAAQEVAAIYSVAGRPVPGRPPWVAPDATTTTPMGMFGSAWRTGRPGAASLAHRGVLLLVNAADFSAQVLNGLREPMTSGEVRLSSSSTAMRLPARFQLAATTRLCRCPSADHVCACNAQAKRRYLARLSKFRQAIPVHVCVAPIPAGAWRSRSAEESTAVAAERVAAARDRAAARLAGTPWVTNAEVPDAELRSVLRAEPDAIAVFATAAHTVLTASTFPKALRVAWTVADLNGVSRPGRAEAEIALKLLSGGPSW